MVGLTSQSDANANHLKGYALQAPYPLPLPPAQRLLILSRKGLVWRDGLRLDLETLLEPKRAELTAIWCPSAYLFNNTPLNEVSQTRNRTNTSNTRCVCVLVSQPGPQGWLVADFGAPKRRVTKLKETCLQYNHNHVQS